MATFTTKFADQYGNECEWNSPNAFYEWVESRLTVEEEREAVTDFVEWMTDYRTLSEEEFEALADDVRIVYEDRDHDSWFQMDFASTGRGDGTGEWHSVTEYHRLRNIA